MKYNDAQAAFDQAAGKEKELNDKIKRWSVKAISGATTKEKEKAQKFVDLYKKQLTKIESAKTAATGVFNKQKQEKTKQAGLEKARLAREAKDREYADTQAQVADAEGMLGEIEEKMDKYNAELA